MSTIPDQVQILRHWYRHVADEPLFVDQVSAREINSRNYLVRCGAPSTTPRFVLKEEVIQDEEALGLRLRKIRVHNQCSPNIEILPTLVETDDGTPWVLSGNLLYTLTEFCAGNAYRASSRAVAEAARGLARLHRLLRSTAESLPRASLYEDLSPSEIEVVIKKLHEESECSRFAEEVEVLIRGDLQTYYEEFHSALVDEEHPEEDNLPRELTHYDFHPANAVFRGDRLAAILDLDSIATDFRMQAVSFSCSRFAETWGIWHFLGAYNQVDPLTVDEIRLYPLFVRREAVRRINWIIRVNILEGRDLWRGELDKHLKSIQQTQQSNMEFNQSDAEILMKMETASRSTS